MSSWYYVEGKDRVGPVSEDELTHLLANKTIGSDTFMWKKGMESWTKFDEVTELQGFGSTGKDDVDSIQSIPELGEYEMKDIDWTSVEKHKRIFMIKVGPDRGLSSETEYGPFSIDELTRAYKENRINDKTFIFSTGMKDWEVLAELPIFELEFSHIPNQATEVDRRDSLRKPFVARMFFHDDKKVFEGVCRDISSGGLQVLVADYDIHVGDEIALNVHPKNDKYCFSASGKVVRVLDGERGFSLRFTNLSNEAHKAIESYIEDY